jgi:hypothetical protein
MKLRTIHSHKRVGKTCDLFYIYKQPWAGKSTVKKYKSKKLNFYNNNNNLEQTRKGKLPQQKLKNNKNNKLK